MLSLESGVLVPIPKNVSADIVPVVDIVPSETILLTSEILPDASTSNLPDAAWIVVPTIKFVAALKVD